MNDDGIKRERLSAKAEAIRLLKSEHYCGTKQAYEYLKEKGECYELAIQIAKTFPSGHAPKPKEIAYLKEVLSGRPLHDSISLKLYGRGYEDGLPRKEQEKVRDRAEQWLAKNFREFCLSYYDAIQGCETGFGRKLLFAETCVSYFGEGIRDIAMSDADLVENEDFINEVEGQWRARYFGPGETYKRMVTDRVQNRDGYQRSLIADFFDAIYYNPVTARFAGGTLPETFEEAVAYVRRMHETLKNLGEKDGLLEYMLKILGRHRSFVARRLSEYEKSEPV